MGCVYVMKAKNVCKIGVTGGDVKRRAKAIQTGCPWPIDDIWTSEPTDNAYACEALLHLDFKDFRTFGEWFEIPFELACLAAECVTKGITKETKIVEIIRENKALETKNKKLEAELKKYRKQKQAGKPAKQIGFLSVTEASKITGLSQHYLRCGVREGSIPHIKSGNKYLINIREFMKSIDEQSSWNGV